MRKLIIAAMVSSIVSGSAMAAANKNGDPYVMGFEAYAKEMQRLGPDKHNPWRDGLAEQGRGRRSTEEEANGAH